jgi:hypothetical protein
LNASGYVQKGALLAGEHEYTALSESGLSKRLSR